MQYHGQGILSKFSTLALQFVRVDFLRHNLVTAKHPSLIINGFLRNFLNKEMFYMDTFHPYRYRNHFKKIKWRNNRSGSLGARR